MRLQALIIFGFCLFYAILAQDLDVRCYSCGYVINPDGSKDKDGDIPFCNDNATDSDMIVNAGPVSICPLTLMLKSVNTNHSDIRVCFNRCIH